MKVVRHMPYATKKPVRVEYIQFISDDHEHTKQLEAWGQLSGLFGIDEETNLIKAIDTYVDIDGLAEPVRITLLKVKTLEGWVVAQKGDYIIKGAENKEFWPVRKDIFEKTYNIETEQIKRGATVNSGAVAFTQNNATSGTRSNY
jgi:hypothetical protein